MKKIILSLLTILIAIMGVSYGDSSVIVLEKDGAIAQVNQEEPLSASVADAPPPNEEHIITKPAPPFVEVKADEEPVMKQSRFSDDIPLTYEEQDLLQAACEEFDIPYALALGLIEKESTFQNIIGDGGASVGYMQIQPKWHLDRMERLGVTDLMDPSGNFRVGCDLLSELYVRCDNWDTALTVYNMGHDPGYITSYAKEVMKNYAQWQSIVGNYI